MKELLILAFLFLSFTVFAQNRDDTISVEDIYEKLLENNSEDAEDSQLLDDLEALNQNKLDLNNATKAQLESIPYINSIISHRILVYRLKQKFTRTADILKIEGIDTDLYKVLIKFVKVNAPPVRNTTVKNRKYFNLSLRDRFINELQPVRGFLEDSIYTGSRPKIYNRFIVSYFPSIGTINAGIVQEKDAGEKKIFDHLSGYIEYKSNGFINHILAGDYNLEFGQGITLWSPLGFSKGNDVSAIKKNAGEIDSYVSVNEVQFFRGGAAKFKLFTSFADFSFYGFYSKNAFDASIDTTLNELSTYYYDGYHRTLREQERENAAKETMYGGRLFFEKGSMNVGITYYKTIYDKDFKKDNLYEFSGSKANALGADYNFILYNTNFFGEWARSYTGAIGGLSGIKSYFFERNKYSLEAMVLFRYYPKDFIMLHSYGFGEKSGETRNETGIYSGFKFKIPGLLDLNVYYDQYKFPYRSFFIPVPVAGNDLLLYSEVKINRQLSLTAKFKSENKEDVIRQKDIYQIERNFVFVRDNKNYRLQFDYDISNNFHIRSRFEYVSVDFAGFQPSQKGLLFFTDLRIKPFNLLTFDTRFIIFQTDSYDSRIYEYEGELEGVVSNIGLYGKGRRWYMMLKYRPFQYMQLSAKYSETIYEGVRSIGTGYDEITGDLKNRLSLQLDLKF